MSTIPPYRGATLTPDQAASLAEAWGTPLYVVDGDHFRRTIRETIAALRNAWPESEVAYASKANSTLALLRIAADEGCLIDCASEGELRAALEAGVSPNRLNLHGSNKSEGARRLAFELPIREIIADDFGDLAAFVAAQKEGKALPTLLLRLCPEVRAETNAKISTGHNESKFGFGMADAREAVAYCLAHELPLVGFHAHVGSQLLDPRAQVEAARTLVNFAVEMERTLGFRAQVINVGGGRGIEYVRGAQPAGLEPWMQEIAQALRESLPPTWPLPKLVIEPGRSLIGDAGVTLYRVGVRKERPSGPLLIVDGGLSDNPRPIMYGGTYLVENLTRSSDQKATFQVAGSHCETDTLFDGVDLPIDSQAGDLLQVLGTGAYNAAMASNYNRFLRPPTVLLEQGEARLLRRRETWEDLFACEVLP